MAVLSVIYTLVRRLQLVSQGSSILGSFQALEGRKIGVGERTELLSQPGSKARSHQAYSEKWGVEPSLGFWMGEARAGYHVQIPPSQEARPLLAGGNAYIPCTGRQSIKQWAAREVPMCWL